MQGWTRPNAARLRGSGVVCCGASKQRRVGRVHCLLTFSARAGLAVLLPLSLHTAVSPPPFACSQSDTDPLDVDNLPPTRRSTPSPSSFLSSPSSARPSPVQLIRGSTPFCHSFILPTMLRLTLLSAAAISAVRASVVSTSVFPNSACSGASNSLSGLVGVGKVTLNNGQVELHCGCASDGLADFEACPSSSHGESVCNGVYNIESGEFTASCGVVACSGSDCPTTVVNTVAVDENDCYNSEKGSIGVVTVDGEAKCGCSAEADGAEFEACPSPANGRATCVQTDNDFLGGAYDHKVKVECGVTCDEGFFLTPGGKCIQLAKRAVSGPSGGFHSMGPGKVGPSSTWPGYGSSTPSTATPTSRHPHHAHSTTPSSSATTTSYSYKHHHHHKSSSGHPSASTKLPFHSRVSSHSMHTSSTTKHHGHHAHPTTPSGSQSTTTTHPYKHHHHGSSKPHHGSSTKVPFVSRTPSTSASTSPATKVPFKSRTSSHHYGSSTHGHHTSPTSRHPHHAHPTSGASTSTTTSYSYKHHHHHKTHGHGSSSTGHGSTKVPFVSRTHTSAPAGSPTTTPASTTTTSYPGPGKVGPSPGPSQRARRAGEEFVFSDACAQDERTCPSGDFGDFSCVRLDDITECGGCHSTNDAKNCLEIVGASSVACLRGGCVVRSCQVGYVQTSEGTCELKA
ncbi:Asparagine-linked glycosylation protein 2 [Rhodotorula toruloides]|nr:Asparagine-linked glycosylation protein 2 [Rhodotorula toruloides]